MDQFQNKELACADHGGKFIWTAGEQEFMANLKADGKIERINEPRRCKPCRDKRKEGQK